MLASQMALVLLLLLLLLLLLSSSSPLSDMMMVMHPHDIASSETCLLIEDDVVEFVAAGSKTYTNTSDDRNIGAIDEFNSEINSDLDIIKLEFGNVITESMNSNLDCPIKLNLILTCNLHSLSRAS